MSMSRYPLTPPPSSPLHPRQHSPPRGASGSTSRIAPAGRPNASARVHPRNDMEAYFMSVCSDVEPTTDEELIQEFREQGIPEADIPQAIKDFDAQMDKRIAEWCGESGGLQILGAKPNNGDTKFQVFPIPNTRLAIRMWDGGMEEYRQYFLDFIDIDKQIPVNSPRGYEIHSVGTPGMMPMAGRLPSWENALGVQSADILPGEEKFCVPEGSHWCLKRTGWPDFYFAVPFRRVELAQFALPIDFQPGYH